jgi:hypothetical protein
MSDDKQLTIEEHNARIAEMKAATERVRKWLDDEVAPMTLLRPADIRKLLERIATYEASITWHTDCLNCPNLYDQLYAATEREKIAGDALRAIAKYLDVADGPTDEARLAQEALKKLDAG